MKTQLNALNSYRLAGLVACLSVMSGMGLPQVAQAAPAAGTVDLIASPPELTASVAPNLVLTFDDSGSMGNDYMGDFRPYTPSGTNTGWGTANSDNPWRCAGVIDPANTDPANPRSLTMNGVYYNPNSTYRPPLKADGITEFLAAPFTGAWDNGIVKNRPTGPGASTARNLTTFSGASFCGNKAGYYQLKAATSLSFDATEHLDAASLVRLYAKANWEWVALPAAQQANFANWYSYYRNRQMAAISSVSRAFAPFDQNVRVAWQNINSNQINATTKIYKFADGADTANVRTRFYDWLFAIPASGGTPNQAAAVLAGDFFTRATGTDTNPYWDRDLNRELSCRQNFHIQMTDGLWNGGTKTTATNDNNPTTQILPDERKYITTDPQSKIMWNELGPAARSMADIAFHYWRTNLRPGFTNPADASKPRLDVPPFLPDRSTSLFGPPLSTGDNPLDNKEIYWNPANDPATWPHLVQFMIGFGAQGTILQNQASYDDLRAGTVAWPATVAGTDDARKIDDIWHAAINSRGQFFSASNPQDLITALQKIISSIIARRGASTAMSVSLPIVTDGTTGYSAGYDTTDWSGFVIRNSLDPVDASPTGVLWDAGCKLTGGACPSMPSQTYPVRDPNDRIIFTSDGVPNSAKPFRWSSLNATQQKALNIEPSTLRVDIAPTTTHAGCAGATTQWDCDANGALRVNYIRGDRTYETTASPRFRVRSSVLGSVIKAQPEYVSSPSSGYRDIFPVGSAERSISADSYAQYQNAKFQRDPMLYVGANDGMLHAFNANNGKEDWAYVPNTIINNFRLVKSTQFDVGLIAGVDAAPGEVDVSFDGTWQTLLVGSMRLGGRGIYALDVSSPKIASESAATGVPLWEFNSGPLNQGPDTGGPCASGAKFCRSLGYTFDSVNVARLHYESSGPGTNAWYALVSSGYFPTDPLDPSSLEAAAGRTSLLVINLQTGELVREIQTSIAPQIRPAGFKTFGLSTPVVYDYGSDQISDIAVAGDLAGNLWRFDLSDPDPTKWSVDLMFTSYSAGGAALAGDQPFSFQPTSLRDPKTLRPIFIIGTGKYLGFPDRTSLIPEQAYYGVRDLGKGNVNYPITVNNLITQNFTQDASDVRKTTGWASAKTLPASAPPTPPMILGNPNVTVGGTVAVPGLGWRIQINKRVGAAPGTPEAGERAQRRAAPLFSANLALLYSLIPKGEDPCAPGARYALMVVDGATGGAPARRDLPANAVPGIGTIGAVLPLTSPPGNPVTRPGGGGLLIPGLPPSMGDDIKDALNEALSDDVWHRGAWRQLLDLL